MQTQLYLDDTARLGLPSPEVRNIQVDCVQLAMTEGCSIYYGAFLNNGFRLLPKSLKKIYPSLSCWKGIQNLRNELSEFPGGQSESNVLFASRTFELARFSIDLLLKKSKRPFSTDLDWPEYNNLLKQASKARKRTPVTFSIRDKIFRENKSESQVIESITKSYSENKCDGLFLTVISNDGIRLPVVKAIKSLSKLSSPPKFIVLDGAQAFNHIPIKDELAHCDFFITGTHKWFQAHNPMGLGFYSNSRSKDFIEDTLCRDIKSLKISDPLLGFTQEVLTKCERRYGETINPLPLFSAQAALNHAKRLSLPETFKVQLKNALTLKGYAFGSYWEVVETQPEFQSGILLMEHKDPICSFDGPDARNVFQDYGIAITHYPPHRARISAPKVLLTKKEIEFFDKAVNTSNVTPGTITRPYPPKRPNSNSQF